MTADTFAAYAADRPDARFSDWLRARAEPEWSDAAGSRFVRELAAGTLDDAAFRRYLVQDYAFVGTLAGTFGHAVGHAPDMDAKRRLTGFLATLTDEENDYFERSFDALGVPEDGRADPERAAVTAAFEDLLVRAAHEGGYAETLAVLVPAEWIYLTWASDAAEGEPPEAFYLREWIDLHANPEFESFVGWLRGELDEHGPGLSARRQARVERLFCRTVALEADFFAMPYR